MTCTRTVDAAECRSPASMDYFVRAREPIRPADAVAALLILEDGRYVMQLRDERSDIFYPGHWGCFGGAVEQGEKPLDALRRELFEELEYRIDRQSEFTRFEFDFDRLGHPVVYRLYFEVPVSSGAFDSFVLHEGQEVRAFWAKQLLTSERVAPYDAFAIWIHMSRDRLVAGQRSREGR